VRCIPAALGRLIGERPPPHYRRTICRRTTDQHEKERTMATETSVTWLTQDAYDRLVAELETLSTSARVDIANKIESARQEGDLKENAGYHAAKEEQGKMEARIRTLTLLLRTAEVGHAPESKGIVEPGTVITATIAGDESRFLIGSREIAGDSDLDVYSEKSPLGEAIIGLKVGAKTSYETPTGKQIEVEIHLVETFTG
jgi:transcription elongation factor GreA